MSRKSPLVPLIGALLPLYLALCCAAPPHKAKDMPVQSRETSAEKDVMLQGVSPSETLESEAETSLPPGRTFKYLEVEGFLPAPMAMPTGNAPKGGHPVAIIAHGAGGRGEQHCQFWDARLPLNVWLVCPAGSLLRRSEPGGGAFFPDHRALRAELRALRAAMLSKHGAQIQTDHWTFIAYSQGATMGALAIVSPKEAKEAERIFTRLVLIEGGGEYWNMQRVKSFQSAGGLSVTLACGTKGCERHARRSLPVFKKMGLQSAFSNAPGGGHTYGGSVGETLMVEMKRMF